MWRRALIYFDLAKDDDERSHRKPRHVEIFIAAVTIGVTFPLLIGSAGVDLGENGGEYAGALSVVLLFAFRLAPWFRGSPPADD